MFGVQGDLVLKYIETKATNQDTIVSELNSDSTSWGNYKNNNWTITNGSAKYWTEYWTEANGYEAGWKDGAYGPKNSTSTSILLSTGADSSFSKQGIYDLAGNVFEWTLEYTGSRFYPGRPAGGGFSDEGDVIPAGYRYYGVAGDYDRPSSISGFRVTLF